MQSIKYTHIFAHMNTISSQLQRFSTKRLLEGALKRGWALNRGFAVYIYNIHIRCFFYKKHLYKKHEAEITDPVDC